MSRLCEWDYLIPATKDEHIAVCKSVVREKGKVLTLGATLSASEGTDWGTGPIMSTTWEIDDYPLVRIEQTNDGPRLRYDASDVWRYWINRDHAWRAK
ncbi:hypothetical protein UFOVP823_9 [uncultured Caudovirales phage]|uniref:Uncharacterized protein n=1 Tax=uncultured Caudovirales phage TaxID=2100421 RepID=A0A6J5PC01_9CAUD|nr:hypothetical protein UFOVP823_9 [uncultured Caudovirales phage]